MGALASSIFDTDIGTLLHGYQLCAATEGKSPNANAIVTNSVSYFLDFLTSQGISTEVTRITQREIRAFILQLQQKRCFSNHRFNHVQDRWLSGHTINCYLRSLRIFFSWLISEGILESNPFVPPASKNHDLAELVLMGRFLGV